MLLRSKLPPFQELASEAKFPAILGKCLFEAVVPNVMHIYVCVYMYVYFCVCVCVCMYGYKVESAMLYIHVCVYTCICICVYVCMYVCIGVCMRMRVCIDIKLNQRYLLN
jgi:hypothetical protein